MTFPVMPAVAPYHKEAPTITYIGRNFNSGDGFPSGAKTLTSGTKLVVVCCELAGSPAASNVKVGGVSMTQASQTGVVGARSASVWYLQTSLSGSQNITGSGGSGRSALDVYEIRGYSSDDPYWAGTDTSTTSSVSIEVPTSTNTIVVGSGADGYNIITVTADRGVAPTFVTARYESATSHFSWYQRPTVRGPTIYTASGGATNTYVVAAAAWR